jgi:hypothetical protein
LPIRLVDKLVPARKRKSRRIFIKRFFMRFAAGSATLCSLLFNFGKQPDRQAFNIQHSTFNAQHRTADCPNSEPLRTGGAGCRADFPVCRFTELSSSVFPFTSHRTGSDAGCLADERAAGKPPNRQTGKSALQIRAPGVLLRLTYSASSELALRCGGDAV